MLKGYNYRDPKWSFDSSDSTQQDFLNTIHNLHVILCDTVSIEHGFIEHRNNENKELFVTFQPTSFIYAFFVLNILYNYDWPKSLRYKCEVTYEKRKPRLSETDKIKLYRDFCFEDTSFSDAFKKRFRAILNYEFSNKEILKSLDQIVVDSRISKETRSNFIEAFKHILDENRLEEFSDDVYTCLSFIYIIRCNVLHGQKSIKEILDNETECTKLKIYSWFIIASCQMCFSYLDYKRVPYYPLDTKLTSISTYDELIGNIQL